MAPGPWRRLVVLALVGNGNTDTELTSWMLGILLLSVAVLGRRRFSLNARRAGRGRVVAEDGGTANALDG